VSAPIPPFSEIGLPAPAPLLEALYLATYVLHFAFMGMALGGGLILAANQLLFLFGSHDEAARARLRDADAKIARALPMAVSGTITTGIAPLLFVQVLYGPVWYSANALQPWAWLAIIPTLLVAFYGVYALKALEGSPRLRALLGGAVGLAFLAIAAVFVSNALVVERPGRWEELRRGLHRPFFIDDPTYLPRLLHDVAGAFAVAGLWVARLGLPRRGLLTTALASAAQLPLLGWRLAVEAEGARAALAGAIGLTHAATAVAVLAGAAAAFAALQGARERLARAIPITTALAALSLAAWAVARLSIRDAALASRFVAAEAPLRPQWGPLVAFGAVAVVGALLLTLLARIALAAARARRESDEPSGSVEAPPAGAGGPS